MKWSMVFILIILIILLSNFIMAMKAHALDLNNYKTVASNLLLQRGAN